MFLALINYFKPMLRLLVLVFTFLVLFPKVLDRVDSRGIASLPFAISVDDSSLAVVALTDIRSNFESSDKAQEPDIFANWGQVTLNAGNESQPILDKIFPPEPMEPAPEMKADPGQLTGMVISQKSIPASIVLAGAAPKKIEEMSLKNVYGEWESLEIRKKKLLTAAKNEDLMQPSIQQKAQKLIEQALQDKKREQVRRVITSQTGGQILVSKPGTVTSSSQPSNKKRSAENTTAGKEVAQQDLRPTKWKDHHERPLLISGSLSFANGLAFTNDQHLSISRVFDGESKETAKIWIRDARFEIPVKRAKGYLIAELHDRSGLLVAYTEYDFSELPEVAKNEYKVKGLHLKLKPVEQGAIVRVISGYSYNEKVIPIDDAVVTLQPFDSELKQDMDGRYVEPSLEAGSDIIVKAEANQHWPTLTRVTSGTVASVRLFHNSMMKALIDIVSLNEMEREENQSKGIIWGMVTQNGKPVSNARVEISGDTGPVSYINNFYLPDVALSKTSENGMFAIVGAEDGMQSLRIVYNDIQYPAQVIRTETGHVSFIEINFEKLKSVRLKVVDEFNQNQPVDATIRSLGSETIIDNITTALDMESQKFPLSYHFLEADAGLDYKLIRVEEPLNQRHVHFPLVQSQWLDGILARLKVNQVAETGVIVGWIKEDGFDVILDDGSTHPGMSTLFFDESGRLISQNENPTGFIIYNVPVGQRTVTVLPHSKKTVITKVLTVDSEFVSVVYK